MNHYGVKGMKWGYPKIFLDGKRCKRCKKRWDANYDIDTGQYLCPKCWDKVKLTRWERCQKLFYTHRPAIFGSLLGVVFGALILIAWLMGHLS